METSGLNHDGAGARSPDAARPRQPLAWVALLVVPAVVLALSAIIASASGERWLYPSYDPDYEYLVNSLSVAEGAAPRHTDHPGTTLQELGAGVLLARHVIAGASVRQDALQNPESALTTISVALRLLHAAALVGLGAMSWRLTRSVGCAMAAQTASALSFVGLMSLWRVDPEPLVAAAAMAVAWVTLAALSKPGWTNTRIAAVSGLIAGLGMVSKVTFLPVCIVPLWAVWRWRPLGVYLGCAATAALVAMIPILGQMRRVAGWLVSLLVHDGRHGVSHGHVFIDPTRYLFNLRLMLTEEPVAAAAAGASGVLLLHLWGTRRWRSLAPEDRRAAWALAVVAAAEVAQYLMVAKHTGARYLVPGLALAGLNVTLAYGILKAAYSAADRRAAAGTAVAALLAGSVWVGVRLSREVSHIRQGGIAMPAIREAAVRRAAADGSMIVTAYGSSSPIFALIDADAWAGYRYRADLARLFPTEITIDEFTKDYLLAGEKLTPAQVREWAAQGRLLFQGRRPALPTEFAYDTVEETWWEGLYRARPRPGGDAAPLPSP